MPLEYQTVPLPQRLAYYIKTACAKGAFFPVIEILNRFLKTAKKSMQLRNKRYVIAELKKIAPNFGLKFITIRENGKVFLGVTSAKNSHFEEKRSKYENIIVAFLQKVEEAQGEEVLAFEEIQKLSQICRKSLTTVMHEIRSRAQALYLHFEKVGKFLMVKSTKNFVDYHGNPGAKNVTPSGASVLKAEELEKAKDLNRNTPRGEVRFNGDQRTKKAFWLMRLLSRQFYDNIKVKLNEKMLYRFSEWAINQGFDDKKIQNVFNSALLKRHADATDMGINMQNFKFKFEMSSTVSLAKQLLLKDGKTSNQRWAELKSDVFPKRALIMAAPSSDESLHDDPFDPEAFKETMIAQGADPRELAWMTPKKAQVAPPVQEESFEYDPNEDPIERLQKTFDRMRFIDGTDEFYLIPEKSSACA